MIWRRVVDLFRRRRLDADLDAQLAYHLDALEAEYRATGLAPDDARAAARRAMGGLTQVKDEYRDQLRIPIVDTIRQDARYALRAMRHNVTFTLVAVSTLAIGIGANTGVFSVVNSVLLKPLSYPRADDLVALRLTAPGAPGLADGLRLSPSMYRTFADHNRVFQSLGVWIATRGTITEVGEPEDVRAIGVSDGLLETFNVPPAAGRWFVAEEFLGPQRPPPTVLRVYTTMMLSYGYWQRRFGGDPSVVGRTLTVDGLPKKVVGVMPDGFRVVNADTEMIFPLSFDVSRFTLDGFNYQGVARLRRGVTIAQANADLSRLIPTWMQSWSDGPGTSPRSYESWNIAAALRPLKDDVIGGVTDVLWVVMGTIGVVMLIACANVTNLLLVRGEVRQKELSVRAALGASRGRVVGSLLVESVLLGLLGGALGAALAYAGVRVLRTIGPPNLPRLGEIAVDARTLAFAAGLSLLSSVLFGLIPAVKYTTPRIAAALGSLGRTTSVSRERHRVRSALVVVQVALALVLLVSAGLMIRTFQSIRTMDPGFTQPDHLQILRIFVSSVAPTAEQATRIENAIQDSLASIPGVTSAAFGSAMPMEGFGPNLGVVNLGSIRAQDQTAPPSDSPPVRLFKYASPGFFRTAGTRVVAGREITWAEVYDLRPVVVVSENLARELWGTASAAIGKRIRHLPEMPWHEVIGVVQDVRENGVYEAAPPTVYWPTMSASLNARPGRPNAIRGVSFIVRSDRPLTAAFLNQIRQAVWAVNPGLPAAPRTMREIYDQSLARTSFTLVMLAIAASMALLLGIVGIYGVIAYVVSQRRREIGIRAALGAQRGELQRMFVRHGLALAGIGVAVGLGAAAALTRLMSTLLYGVTPLDPVTYLAVPVVLVAATVLASYVPARRAASVDPVEALVGE